MAWDGRDLKDHQAPSPVPQAGLPTSTLNARLDQAARAPSNVALDSSRDGESPLLYALVGNVIPAFTCSVECVTFSLVPLSPT